MTNLDDTKTDVSLSQAWQQARGMVKNGPLMAIFWAINTGDIYYLEQISEVLFAQHYAIGERTSIEANQELTRLCWPFRIGMGGWMDDSHHFNLSIIATVDSNTTAFLHLRPADSTGNERKPTVALVNDKEVDLLVVLTHFQNLFVAAQNNPAYRSC